MGAALNIAGQPFGRLTAIEAVGRDKHGKIQWRFRCECGGEKTAIASEVKQGKIASCGCLANETRGENSRNNRDKIAAAKTKHGFAITRPSEYCTWKCMRQRCMNPNCEDYTDYGGRGITVCDRWSDFSLFLADMGWKPSPKHTIDRIENSKGYEPGNCRWATNVEQANNRRPRRKSNGALS